MPTSREHHASLMAEFPAMGGHPVLGKWLYLPTAHDGFEETAQGIVEHILRGDPRLGVEPSARKGGKTSPRPPARRKKPPAL